MKVIPELLETIVKTQFIDEADIVKLGNGVGTVRVDVRNVEQLKHEAKCRDFNLTVDEPPERGGTNTGLNPLGYFLLGGASCFLNQLVKVAMVNKLNLDSLEITARGHIKRTGGREFTDIIYDVRLVGSESDENLKDLLYEGEKRCYVHQTLKKAIPLTTNLSLNGKLVTSHTLGPDTS